MALKAVPSCEIVSPLVCQKVRTDAGVCLAWV